MKGQSWNPKGLTSIWTLLTRPSLSLKREGIKAICFDKDNTLTAPYSVDIHPPFKAAWKECIDTFGSEQVVIVSNSAGSNNDVGYAEATRIQESLKIHVIRHAEKKPGGAQDLFNHFPSLQPSQIAVVGDRLLTDIVYGNKMGAFTILTTKIITEEGDNRFALHLRRFENRILVPFLNTLGVKPPSHFLTSIHSLIRKQ
ncbi:hypothetical protein HDU79_003620 [Rhizoclosmatium sp. JEL0117]|nr:hypothetical protein HDU79_003620 [Rhizoclosmatium sp. JEL0117]